MPADALAFAPPESTRTSNTDDDAWLTSRTAAVHAMCCAATLRHAVARGDLQSRRIGSRLRFKKIWVDTWLSADPPRDTSPAALERQLARARALSARGKTAAAARWAKAQARHA